MRIFDEDFRRFAQVEHGVGRFDFDEGLRPLLVPKGGRTKF